MPHVKVHKLASTKHNSSLKDAANGSCIHALFASVPRFQTLKPIFKVKIT